jgi:hypothetical protein
MVGHSSRRLARQCHTPISDYRSCTGLNIFCGVVVDWSSSEQWRGAHVRSNASAAVLSACVSVYVCVARKACVFSWNGTCSLAQSARLQKAALVACVALLQQCMLVLITITHFLFHRRIVAEHYQTRCATRVTPSLRARSLSKLSRPPLRLPTRRGAWH